MAVCRSGEMSVGNEQELAGRGGSCFVK